MIKLRYSLAAGEYQVAVTEIFCIGFDSYTSVGIKMPVAESITVIPTDAEIVLSLGWFYVKNLFHIYGYTFHTIIFQLLNETPQCVGGKDCWVIEIILGS